MCVCWCVCKRVANADDFMGCNLLVEYVWCNKIISERNFNHFYGSAVDDAINIVIR